MVEGSKIEGPGIRTTVDGVNRIVSQEEYRALHEPHYEQARYVPPYVNGRDADALLRPSLTTVVFDPRAMF